MFSGTPCQVAGLRKFLRRDYPNLLLVDLVCHGVPSQKLLRDNVQRVLRESGVADGNYQVTFRRKGRQTSELRFGVFLSEDAKPVVSGRPVDFPSNDYIAAFMAGLIFRENCFTCPYARPERGSDITIADFWGLQPCSVPKGSGVSLLLVSTAKGQELADTIREKAVMEERPVAEAVRGNGQLQAPSRRPGNATLSWRTMPPLRSRHIRNACGVIAASCGFERGRGWLLRLSAASRSLVP